jgi:hypothetical protein
MISNEMALLLFLGARRYTRNKIMSWQMAVGDNRTSGCAKRVETDAKA